MNDNDRLGINLVKLFLGLILLAFVAPFIIMIVCATYGLALIPFVIWGIHAWKEKRKEDNFEV